MIAVGYENSTRKNNAAPDAVFNVNGLCMHRQWYFYRFVIPYASVLVYFSLVSRFYMATLVSVCLLAYLLAFFCLSSFRSLLFSGASFCLPCNMCVIYALDESSSHVFFVVCTRARQCECFWSKNEVSAPFLMHLMHIKCSDFQFGFASKKVQLKKTHTHTCTCIFT